MGKSNEYSGVRRLLEHMMYSIYIYMVYLYIHVSIYIYMFINIYIYINIMYMYFNEYVARGKFW